MGRLVDVRRRTELLDGVVAYLAERGIAGVSLRPMAKSLGVSVNALVHHFGTKDDIVVAALRRAVDVQDQVQARWTARNPGSRRPNCSGAGGDGSTPRRRTWRWCDSGSRPPPSTRPRPDCRDRCGPIRSGCGDRTSSSAWSPRVSRATSPRRGVAREGDVHRPRRRPARDRRAAPPHPRARGRPRPAGTGRVGERRPVRPGHPRRPATATAATPPSREFRRPRAPKLRIEFRRRRGRS